MKEPYLVFRLAGQRFALPLDRIERVVRAAAVTPLPDAPAVVLGLIDLGGSILPVFSLRRRFAWPDEELDPEHQFLIVRLQDRLAALVVEKAEGVRDVEEASVPVPVEQVGERSIAGVMRGPDGLVLIHDLDTMLTASQTMELAEAIRSWTQGSPRG